MSLRQAQGEAIRFAAQLRMWRSENSGALGFVTIEGEPADAIRGHELMRRLELGKRSGFGSVKVVVRVGGSEWRTSVFPQKSGGWFLPVKQAIQRAEGLAEGASFEGELELL